MMPDEMNSRNELPESNAIFAPVDEIKRIEKVLFNLESLQQELLKVAEGMKPISFD